MSQSALPSSVSAPGTSPGTSPLTGQDDLDAALKKHFGHNSFRPMQRQIITDLIQGRDAFVVMPTGGGKSLCYQLPAVLAAGTAVVISPLIALMQDQVKALEAGGIATGLLNSTVSARDIYDREVRARNGEFKLIYMSPERLMRPAGMNLVKQLNLSMFIIDEAHCISEWGHDFRPEYRMLGQLRKRFADVPIAAFTATATRRVAQDIVKQLHLPQVKKYRGDFERKNLHYHVRPKQKAFEQIVRYLEEHRESDGIIYCFSRNATDMMAGKLQARGIAALPYHAGMDKEQRSRNQHEFVYGKARVITATIAFGMGIDKPDVRFVIHADLPRNIEAYYQETGRAGRDGIDSDCILFFSHGDRAKHERFIEEKEDEQEKAHAYQMLDKMIAYAYDTGCRCAKVLDYFGEQHPGSCSHCDNCLLPPKFTDATENARKLLSAVARTGQRFGISHVVNVLKAVDNERTLGYGHQELSVWGIGVDEPAPYWRRLAASLIHAQQLGQTKDDFRTLYLTPQSKPVLRGQVDVEVVVPRAAGKPKAAKVSPAVVTSQGPVDQELFDSLRSLRRELAGRQNVPPYVVFSDASLRHMAQEYPVTPQQFLQISGVGPHKLKKYGDQFMAIIASHQPPPGSPGGSGN